MANQDRALARLEKAITRLEQALDRSLRTNGGASPADYRRLSADLDSAVARNRDLEGRLEAADSRLGSVVTELKSMLERGDAPGDGSDQRS